MTTNSYKHIDEAIRQVVFQMSRINDTLTHNYKKIDDWELRIQEGYTLDWVRKLVARSEFPETNAEYLRMYEESLTEFQAKRSCLNFVERGDEPSGFAVWQKVKGGEVLIGLDEDGEDQEAASTSTLDSLSEAEELFRANSLTGAAKKLRISNDDAADLKVALPLLIEQQNSEDRA